MKTEWPPLVAVNLEQVYEWATRQKGFRTGLSDDPTSRALNALAHLMEASEPMDMFWAMLGIEAIYVRGQKRILRQIREKSEALFRKPDTLGNALDDMYNFRSRLVHGDLDFPGIMADDLFGTSTKSYYQGIDETVSMAALLLVATFQYMVRRDWDTLDFERLNEPT